VTGPHSGDRPAGELPPPARIPSSFTRPALTRGAPVTRYSVTLRATVDTAEQARDTLALLQANSASVLLDAGVPSVWLSVDPWEDDDTSVLRLPAALQLPEQAVALLAEQGVRVEYLDLPAASNGQAPGA
jgi:hypothetical protein